MSENTRTETTALAERYARVAGHLDERARCAVAATDALSVGRGGITRVAQATGLSRSVIAQGIRELRGEVPVAPAGRVGRPGGGRKPLETHDPSLRADLERLIEPTTRGDPESPLRWTCTSLRKLASELQRQGHQVSHQTVADRLASFRPTRGDGIVIPAGTVHALCDIVVFEVQENSDVTFRLYDWDHVDPKTGRQRPLQVAHALACRDFAQGALGPVAPVVDETTPVLRERLLQCAYFAVSRLTGDAPFTVGAPGTPRVLVCIAGDGQLEHDGARYHVGTGDVLLVPAVVGACVCRPHAAMIVLDISLPEGT